ncbi:MAG TPA: carboxypeptidase-like regulatory domain-containing protein, partial [Chitinophagaceae bacterium]
MIMTIYNPHKILFLKCCVLFGVFAALSRSAFAQEITSVQGIITDAKTHQTLPAVTVAISGTSTGTSADLNGHYALKSQANPKAIQFSFVGYKSVVKDVAPGQVQTINVSLIPDNRMLGNVVIKSSKKTRYRNKDNPAVELIRQVIAHKKTNRLENSNFAEYHQYAK